MELQDLLKRLEIDSPKEFVHMEDLAEILEGEEPVEEGCLYRLFSQADGDAVFSVIQDYFEDLFVGIPEDSSDLYLLLEQIKSMLLGLWQQRNQEENLRDFVSEIVRFQQWYTLENQVICQNTKSGKEEKYSLLHALMVFRLESLGGPKYHYDFQACLDYPIEEYAVRFIDLALQEQ